MTEVYALLDKVEVVEVDGTEVIEIREVGAQGPAGGGVGAPPFVDLPAYTIGMKSPIGDNLQYAFAKVTPDGFWEFDRTIKVPSGSVAIGDEITASEAGSELLIHSNSKARTKILIGSEFDATGSKVPDYLQLEPQVFRVLQPNDSEQISTNPFSFTITTGVAEGRLRQVDQVTFRTYAPATNIRSRVVDVATGSVLRYTPNKAAWDASTPEELAINGGDNFILGDNTLDFNSDEPDSEGVFNSGHSPFRLTSGQEVRIEVKGDNIALLGYQGFPYISQLAQDGDLVDVLTELTLPKKYAEDFTAVQNSTHLVDTTLAPVTITVPESVDVFWVADFDKTWEDNSYVDVNIGVDVVRLDKKNRDKKYLFWRNAEVNQFWVYESTGKIKIKADI